MTTSVPTSQGVTRGLSWSLASSLCLRIGNVLASIIMARLILPEEYGVFAVALTVWSVLGVVAEFGLGTDVVRAERPEPIIPTVTTIGMVTGSALALSMFLAAPTIAAVFESPDSVAAVRIMALGMLVIGFMIVPAALLQRAYRQREIFLANLLGLVASTSVMVVLALQGYGPVALAVGQVVGQAVAVLTMYAVTRHRVRLGFDLEIARASLAFCLPLAAANLVSWLLLTVDNLVVARELGPQLLGLYVLAFNLSSWPMNAVGQAVRVVALPAYSRLTGAEARNGAVVSTLGPLTAVAVVLGIGLATMADPVIRLLYGERWAAAAAALLGLAVFGAMRVVFDLVATFLIAGGRTSVVLVVQLVWIAAMVPAMVVGVRVGGLAGAGWAHVVVALVVVGPAYLLALRAGGVSVAKLARATAPAVLAAPPALVACWLVARWVETPVPALALAGLACVFLYLVPLRRTLTRQVRELRGLAQAGVAHA